MGYFQGKVVWITGASSGIGEALAYELPRRGATLVLGPASPAARARAGPVQPWSEHMIVPLACSVLHGQGLIRVVE